MDILKWISDNYGTLSVISVMLFGLCIKLKGYIKNAIKSLILGNRFYVLFGETPAESIKAIHDAIQSSNDVLEVRQSISEKYLKIGVYICGLDGKCRWTNAYLDGMFGLDSRDMLGNGWLQAIHIDDRERVYEEWIYAVKNMIAYNSNYTICNHRDRVSISVKTTAVAVVADDSSIQCYVGFLEIQDEVPLNCKFKKVKNEDHSG